MPVRASFQPSSPSGLVLGTGDLADALLGPSVRRPRNELAVSSRPPLRSSTTSQQERDAATAVKRPTFLELTSDQVGIPAELKHINKRRKRNQQGLPQ
jgi:hypothetical protein